MNPIVSVIIPNYNHEKFLRKRIDSVLNQSYKDFELIILDDCSTDNSQRVINHYRGNTKVTVIKFNKTNSGSTFKQWNEGIELAKGKYIWIAESDDYADVSFLSVCLNEFYNNPNLGIVYTDSYEVSDENLIGGRWSRWQERSQLNLWTKSFSETGNLINSHYNYIANVIPNASCAVFKKELYLNSIFKDHIENLRYTGDWITWFCILMSADLGYCHLPLNYFRFHANTTRYRAELRLHNVAEQYSALRTFKNLCIVNRDKKIEKERFDEIFSTWNPKLVEIFNTENSSILKLGLSVDKQLILRILKRSLKRSHDVIHSSIKILYAVLLKRNKI